MARRAFFSFHYVPDNWRASQVRNMGVVEGDAPVTDNDWETVTRGGDAAIERWIERQMNGKSCAVVLIGANTAGRKWITHEIKTAWNSGKGVLGIHIHNLKDRTSTQAARGSNPFDYLTLGNDGRKLSSVIRSYDPPHVDSTQVYAHIKNHLEAWVDAAIAQRATT
jgi:hypothetical protein